MRTVSPGRADEEDASRTSPGHHRARHGSHSDALTGARAAAANIHISVTKTICPDGYDMSTATLEVTHRGLRHSRCKHSISRPSRMTPNPIAANADGKRHRDVERTP